MANTIIMLVDDERDFRDGVIPPDTAVHTCRTSGDAIRFLDYASIDGTLIDQVWLDHDLGGNDTIMPFIDHIEELYRDGRLPGIREFVIHTSNPAGRVRMIRALAHIGRVTGVMPSDWLVVS